MSKIRLGARNAHYYRRRYGLVIMLALLVSLSVLSLLTGSKFIPPTDVWGALMGQSDSSDSLIITSLRVPRTLAAILSGMALGGAGALIQALARNPLADPGILGVNAGASLAIVVGMTLFGFDSPIDWLSAACLGALAASLLVWGIGVLPSGRIDPIRLTLAGIALSAVLSGITSSIALLNPLSFDQLRFWLAGTLDIRSIRPIYFLSPAIVIGVAISLTIANTLNMLNLGEELASALGTKVLLSRIAALFSVMLLCGAATALVGPIGFVGLIVPHIARLWCGQDQRWIQVYVLLLGPVLLLSADIIGRLIVPGELRASVVTAFIGAPVLIYLVRKL